jgi:hypothetical protein
MTSWPNKASAGNGAIARRFHAAGLRRAVPEMQRWPLGVSLAFELKLYASLDHRC